MCCERKKQDCVRFLVFRGVVPSRWLPQILECLLPRETGCDPGQVRKVLVWRLGTR